MSERDTDEPPAWAFDLLPAWTRQWQGNRRVRNGLAALRAKSEHPMDPQTFAANFIEAGLRLAWGQRQVPRYVRLGRRWVTDAEGRRALVVPWQDLTAEQRVQWLRQETLAAATYTATDDSLRALYPPYTPYEVELWALSDLGASALGGAEVASVQAEPDEEDEEDECGRHDDARALVTLMVSVASPAQLEIVNAFRSIHQPTTAKVAHYLGKSHGDVHRQMERLRDKLQRAAS